MTFDEFLKECPTASGVLTADGPALLIGGFVIECRGWDSNVANFIATALRMVPQQPLPVEPVAEV